VNTKVQLADGFDRTKSMRYPEERSGIVRTDTIPWTPWVMAGSQFKLLYVNWSIGMSVAMLKLDPGVQTPNHYHFGDAIAHVLQGDFGYEYGHAYENDVFVEGGGIAHKPKIGAQGVTTVTIFFGGLGSVNADGKIEGCTSCDEMYELAKANGAADHIEPPPPRRS
jgi:2,4'-dihydroxyacetophenone dioxygenase